MARTIAIVLLALAAPAAAQQREPTAREEYEMTIGQAKPTPTIPRELREIITESRPERLTVRGLAGQSIPVSLEWFEPSEFATFQNGRYLGFRYVGYEEDGYILVDRRANGRAATLHTGVVPVFSPDGRYFAAAQMTEMSATNLEGVALWEVLPDRTVRRFFSNALLTTIDWRVDRWARPDCVILSSVEIGYQIPETQDYERAVREAPRRLYMLEVDEGVSMNETSAEWACVREEVR